MRPQDTAFLRAVPLLFLQEKYELERYILNYVLALEIDWK